MKHGRLSEYFTGVGAKRLRPGEVDSAVSNQHEMNGVHLWRHILGNEERRFSARMAYLADDDDEPVTTEAVLSWYDSRKKQAHRRAEFRLYYPDNEIIRLAAPGDLCIIARRSDDSLLMLIAEAGSTVERQLQWLFGLGTDGERALPVHQLNPGDGQEIGVAAGQVMAMLGIEPDLTDTSFLEALLDTFGAEFPGTDVFSGYARATSPPVDILADPDMALKTFMDHEEMLFRTLEKHIVQERLARGFEDVEDFFKTSISLQNRRKSRTGYAFENHVQHILVAHGVNFEKPTSKNALSDGTRPDFVFPCVAAFNDPAFPDDRLTILGAKSTCKERWRQVLAEAKRVPEKHLITMEPALSSGTTSEMELSNMRLVVPRELHSGYTAKQQSWIISAQDFIYIAASRQNR